MVSYGTEQMVDQHRVNTYLEFSTLRNYHLNHTCDNIGTDTHKNQEVIPFYSDSHSESQNTVPQSPTHSFTISHLVIVNALRSSFKTCLLHL